MDFSRMPMGWLFWIVLMFALFGLGSFLFLGFAFIQISLFG